MPFEYGLREQRLLVPPGGSMKDIPPEVWSAIDINLAGLRGAWDRMFPTNPVGGCDD